jgi:chromosomal replication initiation ATPase DnaA
LRTHTLPGLRRPCWRDRPWPRNRWRLKRLKRDPEAQLLVKCVSATRKVPLYDLVDERRGLAAVCEARQLAMYLVHVVLGRPQDLVAELFERSRQTVSHACHVVEDRRESDTFDLEVEAIEQRFAQLLREGALDA